MAVDATVARSVEVGETAPADAWSIAPYSRTSTPFQNAT